MALKAVNVFLVIALSACLIQTAICKPKPRDSSVLPDQSVKPLSNEDLKPKEEIIPRSETADLAAVKIPGRISCDSEETTEDPVCLEHCLPKGYTYGLCVSHTCSCI
uniref:Defensin n=1 Tax=Helicoverpa armigera TaxID=29058 RepID=A0A0U2R9B7_HELAM|nr:defensin [Helicoverpa armigera]